MAKKLSEILKNSTGAEIEFVDLIEDEAERDGSPLVKLVLKKSIPLVIGKRRRDRETGDAYNLEADDVEIINLGPEAIAELDQMAEDGIDPFTWVVEGKSGTLRTKLKLDVSNALEVWLVKTSLGNYGRNQANNRRSKSSERVQKMIADQKAKRELKDADVTAAPEVTTVAEEPTEKGKAKAGAKA